MGKTLLKAVVKDLDGVLVDTEGQKYEAWRQTLVQYGIALTAEEYVRNFAGKSGKDNIVYINKQYNVNLTQDDIDVKNSILEGLLANEVILLPYAHESIEFFRSIPLPIAVASSDGQKETEHKLKLAGLEGKFDVTLGTQKKATLDKPAEPQKPHPFIYQKAVGLLGLPAELCLAYEDTSAGVISAKDAGLICIAVPNQWTSLQDFSRADAVVKDLKGAVDYVQKNFQLS